MLKTIKETKNNKKKKVSSLKTSLNVSKVAPNKKSPANKKSRTASKDISSVKSSKIKESPTKKQSKSKVKNILQKPSSIDFLEYYDLPYRYNKTEVKMLYQTPKTLFVYWDISDEDKNFYIEKYGKKFFEQTKPVLVIKNLTMNYTFEIEINDFANCWYFNINDEKCEYYVELGRRSKDSRINIPNNYLHITSSNKIESPNGHILFEKNLNTIFFKDVKTNKTFSKNIADLSFMKYLGKSLHSYKLYEKFYEDKQILNNPTSSFK